MIGHLYTLLLVGGATATPPPPPPAVVQGGGGGGGGGYRSPTPAPRPRTRRTEVDQDDVPEYAAWQRAELLRKQNNDAAVQIIVAILASGALN